MANTILMKNRASDATKPADDDLKQGELAVNSFDGSIYMGTKLAVSGTAGAAATASTWVAGNIKDEDDLSSDSATALATQQSIKAYVDSVPTGDITGVTAGTGLTGGGSSGDITLNAVGGTGLATNANDIALSHLGIESLSDPNADRIMFWDDSAGATAFLTAGSGLTISGTTITAADNNTTYSAGTLLDLDSTTFNVDLTEAGEAGVTVANDYFLFLDGGASGTAAKESMADYAAAIAGTNITASNGVLSGTGNDNTTYTAGTLLDLSSTTFNVDLQEATEAAVAVANDYFLFLDGGATGTAAKESMADYAAAIAGTNITASNGVLSGTGNDNTTYTAGDGLTLDGTEFDLDASLTTVTSMLNNSLKIGRADGQDSIDFGSDDTILFDIDNTERMRVDAAGVDINGNLTVSGDTTVVNILAGAVSNTIQFEGSGADAYETTVGVINPTADRTINFPNTSGTVSLSDTNTTYSAGNGLLLTGTTFTMDDPENGTSINEGTIATDDRMPIWDESASSWKYVTIDNLQDEIDTDTDNNTTYSAGNGISLSTTTFSVAGNTGLDQDSDGLSIDSSVCTLTGAQTLTNKGIDLGSNTLTGSVAEWNTAAQSESFCFLAEAQTLTNKTIDAGAYNT